MRGHEWALVILTALVPACGGGGSPAGAAANASLLIGDAPTDNLASFEATVTAVRLMRNDSSETVNLLASARTIDLLDLIGRSSILQVVAIPDGTYKGARVTFDPSSLAARNLRGDPVAVAASGSEVTTLFAAPVAVSGSRAVQLHLDADLEDALEGDGQGGLVFTPRVEIEELPRTAQAVDDVHGRIRSASSAGRSVLVDLTDRLTGRVVGSMTVKLAGSVALFDDNSAPFVSEAAFFVAAVANARIEAHGTLQPDNTFSATSIKLEPDNDGVASIKGRIVSIDSGAGTLVLRILEIRKGAARVRTVLAGMNNPGTITAAIAQARVLIEQPSPRAGLVSDLEVGQKAHVKFSAFTAEPFPARRIEINDNRPSIDAVVTDVAGLPASFTVHVESHDPAVVSGRVASSTTNVQVSLAADARLFLKLRDAPVIASSRLFAGAKVRIRGKLSGSAASPTVTTSAVRVVPGRIDGIVLSGDSTARTLRVDWDKVDKPFMVGTPADPISATLDAKARVRGDAADVAGVFTLLGGLKQGQRLEVRLFGVSDGQGGLHVHALKASVK